MKPWLSALLLCLCVGSADAAPETLVPLSDWKVGVVDGLSLRCFELATTPQLHWEPCAANFPRQLPAGTVRVLGNERTWAALSAAGADFYDDDGRPMRRSRLRFLRPVRPAASVNGGASTEAEVLRIDDGRYVIGNAVDPDSGMDAPIARTRRRTSPDRAARRTGCCASRRRAHASARWCRRR